MIGTRSCVLIIIDLDNVYPTHLPGICSDIRASQSPIPMLGCSEMAKGWLIIWIWRVDKLSMSDVF